MNAMAPFLALVLTLMLPVLSVAVEAGAEEGGLRMERVQKMIEAARTGRTLVGTMYIAPLIIPGQKPAGGIAAGPVKVPVFKNKEELETAKTRFRELQVETIEFRADSPRPAMSSRNEDGIDVGQNMAAVTRRGEKSKRYLQSGGAGPCVILTLYHPKSKTASLAHLDAGSGTADSIALMLHKMDLKPGDKVEARLIGGTEGLSKDIFLVAIHTLDRLGVSIREVAIKDSDGINRVSREIFNRPEKMSELSERGWRMSDSIIIDTETGEVYDMEGVRSELTPEQKAVRKKAMNQKHGLPVAMVVQ